MKANNRDIDILCVGEVLIDFIGHQKDVLINNTRDYHRYLGGSPTNVAMNSARLGLNAKMVATVGNDGFGEYIFKRLNEVGVQASSIKKISNKPTSVIFVSRSNKTPDFIPFREADYCISEDQIPTELLKETSIFQETILRPRSVLRPKKPKAKEDEIGMETGLQSGSPGPLD